MTRDMEVLRAWIRVVLIITAICSNSVPILYSFSPWRRSVLGKLFMLQAVTLAIAVDLNVLFMIWRPTDVLVLFWINTIILTALAVSTGSLAVFIWVINHYTKRVAHMLLSDKVYQTLKKIVQIGLPGLATLYFTLSAIWGLPYTEEVMGTITAIATFLGVILGISSKTYNSREDKYGGILRIENGEEGSTIRIKDVDPSVLLDENEITFKIDR